MEIYKNNEDLILRDLLFKSADIMKDFAEVKCKRTDCQCENNIESKNNTGDCYWYHASWMYCRIADLVQTPDFLNDYYREFFSLNKPNKNIKILICGTADFTILHHLFQVISVDRVPFINITILDICETPLLICEWYIKWFEDMYKTKINVNYVKKNVFDNGFCDHQFDMITTYCFLSRIKPSQHSLLVTELYRLLKKDGSIIISDVLTPENELDELNYDEYQIQNFINKAKTFFSTVKSKRKHNTIIDLVGLYGNNILEYSIPSIEYILGLFNAFECQTKTYLLPGEINDIEPFFILHAKK